MRHNDNAIREALAAEILSLGWDETTVAGVARHAGVTVGAIYARAESIVELANEVWSHTLSEVLAEPIGEIEEALRAIDSAKLVSVSEWMIRNKGDISVALELVIAALFDDELEEVVGVGFGDILRSHTAVDANRSRVQAAATTLAIGFMLGQALARRHAEVQSLTAREAELLCSYWRAAEIEIDVKLQRPLVRTRDNRDDSGKRRSIIDVLSKRGYRRATISRMARASGLTPGALFARFHSKAELIADAAEHLLYSPLEVWSQYDGVIREFGSPIARTLFLREYMNPGQRDENKILLELARVGEVHPELQKFRTPPDALQRTHLAMALLATYLPEAWELPFCGPFAIGTAT